MADYYADSSALVKRHIPEIGSAWLQALADLDAGHTSITARVSMVEVYSAWRFEMPFRHCTFDHTCGLERWRRGEQQRSNYGVVSPGA
jgi:hypothetical protein